jgi:hypothetical protein
MPIVQPSDTIAEVQTVAGETNALITDRFSQAEELASGYSDAAQGFLDSLLDAADVSDFPMPILANQAIPPIAYKFNPGEVPVEPSTDISLPAYPVEPLLQAIALVTNIQSTLQYELNNGVTGLASWVEKDIWQRDKERERINVDEAKEKIAAEWSTRCFDLPDGVLVAQQSWAEIDYRNKFLDRSRDIVIKQMELAFQNTQFVKTKILDMNKILIDALVEGNKTAILKFSADVESYKTQITAAISQVDEAIKGYTAAGEVYKATADAQAAIANVDVKAADVAITATISQMQLFLKQAEIYLERSRAMATIKVSASEAGGRIAAQLAAGAMAGISVQAHISTQAGVSESYAGQEQLQEQIQATTPTV